METLVFSEQNWFRSRQVALSGINQHGWNMRHEPFAIRYFLLKMVIFHCPSIMLGYQDICPSERCWNLVLTLPEGRCVRKTSPLPARRRNNQLLTYVCYHFMTSVTPWDNFLGHESAQGRTCVGTSLVPCQCINETIYQRGHWRHLGQVLHSRIGCRWLVEEIFAVRSTCFFSTDGWHQRRFESNPWQIVFSFFFEFHDLE